MTSKLEGPPAPSCTMPVPLSAAPLYSRPQRLVALAYGIVCHLLFGASVVAMFISLYHGLTLGLFHLHGWKAALMDGALICQFALAHSLLLSDRGRKFLSRLAPLGLGRDLTTTIFAAIASLQLLATFLFWSPSGIIWVVPVGTVKHLLVTGYVISWILLVKSMNDAGMDVQIGTLGWRSVWRNQRPTYQPFARSGMFKYSRQPIYSSFTLILWTAPVWTPDHLVLTVIWTLYCVMAPVMKEKRYRRFYGEAFARYQRTVPYWFPRFHQAAMTSSPENTRLKSSGIVALPSSGPDCDVAIVGAGPVGLLLANLLGASGLKVVVLEKDLAPPTHSRAIGITPPSLEILDQVGLVDAFVVRGVKIRDVHVHGMADRVGICSFRELPGRHPYILSLPQQQTLGLLEQHLRLHPSVNLLRGREVTSVTQTQDQVQLGFAETQLTARHVVACDGWRSGVRQMLKIRTQERRYGCHFVMGDFTDHSGMEEEAHLFFTPHGAVESFPLPGGIRRWIVQSPGPMMVIPRGYISRIVQQRAGLPLDPDTQLNQSTFNPGRVDCDVLYDHRVILCGDAAHAMSPIGGQGMNVGFADAEMLAGILVRVLQHREDPTFLLETYQQERRRAARLAANRAAQGMWLGTWTGAPASWLRDALLGGLLLKPPFAGLMASRFAMMDVPRVQG